MKENTFMPQPQGIDEKTKNLFAQIEKGFGMVPNIFKIAGNAPKVLEEFLRFASVMKSGSLTPKEHEAVALLVSEINGCHYCVSAHTMIAKASGLSDEEILEIRSGTHQDFKMRSLLKLTIEAVNRKEGISQSVLDDFYKAGYGNKELVEIIGIISEKTFTNLLGRITKPELDFIPAPELKTEVLT